MPTATLEGVDRFGIVQGDLLNISTRHGWLIVVLGAVVACANPDDAGIDAGPPAGADAGLADVGFADGGEADAGAPNDAGAADAGTPDAGAPDGGTPDAGTTDAGPSDGGPMNCTMVPNSCLNGEICLGESCSCIQQIDGRHYLRSDGTVVNWDPATPAVIYEAGAGMLGTVTQIFTGTHHGCARRIDGTVWCWPTSSSGNARGDLGNGSIDATLPATALNIATQVMVSAGVPLTNVARINGGASRAYLATNSCAVTTGGALRCWGSPDASGGGGGTLFNDGTAGNRAFAVEILAAAATPMTGVLEVSIGSRHACVIRNGTTNREVWCWAANIGGPLGQGDQVGRTYPVMVPLPGPAAQLGAGADATCARVADAVYCWGSNNSGQVGIGDRMAPANHDGCINFCKLTPKRVVDSLGAPLANIEDYEMHYLGSCARLADHTLWCWGRSTQSIQTDWAVPASINGVPLTNSARFTTVGSGGWARTMRRLTRDNQLFRVGVAVTPLCP